MDSFISALQEAKLHGLTTDMLGDNRAQWNEMDLDSATVALYKQQISSLIASLSANGNDIGFIIVDGFLLYSDDRALKLLDLPLFLKADRQVLIERRNRRNGYITIEGFWQEPEGYFDNFVWPMYLKYNFKVLDGSFQTKVLDSNKLSIGECVEHTIALIKGII